MESARLEWHVRHSNEYKYQTKNDYGLFGGNVYYTCWREREAVKESVRERKREKRSVQIEKDERQRKSEREK